ncbi:MAG: hypothetical protein P9M14_03155 [Candidatus Alcyoniella australis]|nr:hypothetical protein [Candidatus Alcyoniella australis]
MEQRELRNRLYWSYHRDGLFDVFLGLGLLGFGLTMLLDNAALVVLTWGPWLLFPASKSYLSYPRISRAELRDLPHHTRGLLLLALVGLLLVLLAGLLAVNPGVTTGLISLLRQRFVVSFGLIIAALLAALGLAVHLMRVSLYAAALGLLAIGCQLLGLPLYIAFLLTALIALLCGGALLLCFLRRIPATQIREDA